MTRFPLHTHLNGIFVLAATPMRPDLSLDLDGLTANIDHYLAQGVDGVIVGGTYGEFPSLRHGERVDLYQAAGTAVAGRVPFVCCTASSSTLEAIDLGHEAAAAGADGVMVTPPYVSEVRPADVLHHFREVASASDVPLLVYNSQSIGVELTPEQIVELAGIDGVVGLKQGVLDPCSQVATVAHAGRHIQIMCGSDGAILSALAHGMSGVTSTLSNFMADRFVALHRSILSGDWSTGREMFFAWQPLRDFVARNGQPAATKAAMDLMGLVGGPVRPPFRSLDRADIQTLREVLRELRLEAAEAPVSS